jgi:O-antigen ligase
MVSKLKIKNNFLYLHLVCFIALINSDYIYSALAAKIYLGHLRNILCAILLIVIVIKLLFTNKTVFINKTMLYFLLLLVYMVMSWGWLTPATEYGEQKVIEVVSCIFFVFMISFMFYSDIEIKKYYKCLLIFNFAILILMLSVNDLSNYSIGTRLTIGEINPIWLGRFLGEIMILVIFLVKRKIMDIPKYILLSLLTIGILFTGSKGPLFSLIIAVFTINIINLKKKFSLGNFLKSYFTLILLVLGIILFVKEVVFKVIPISYIKQRFIIENSENAYGSYSRTHLYETSFDAFINHPLLGNGIGSFGYLLSGQDIRDYPHNVILEIMSELGLLGLVLFSIPIIITFIKFYKYVKHENCNYLKITMVLFIYYFLNSLVSGDLGLSNMRLYLYIGLLNHLYVLKADKYYYSSRETTNF